MELHSMPAAIFIYLEAEVPQFRHHLWASSVALWAYRPGCQVRCFSNPLVRADNCPEKADS